MTLLDGYTTYWRKQRIGGIKYCYIGLFECYEYKGSNILLIIDIIQYLNYKYTNIVVVERKIFFFDKHVYKYNYIVSIDKFIFCKFCWYNVE